MYFSNLHNDDSKPISVNQLSDASNNLNQKSFISWFGHKNTSPQLDSEDNHEDEFCNRPAVSGSTLSGKPSIYFICNKQFLIFVIYIECLL